MLKVKPSNMKVRPINKPELRSIMLDWSNKLEWNYSENDVDAYFEINGLGIYALLIEDELAACVSLTKYMQQDKHNVLASIGLFITHENYRGLKLCGPELWKTIIKEISCCNTTCLNSVPRALSYYQGKGFFNTGIRSAHYGSIFNKKKLDEFVKVLENSQLMIDGDIITPVDHTRITRYELSLFQRHFSERHNFIEKWLSRPDACILAYMDKATVIKGYGVMTQCKVETDKIVYRISPLYAETLYVAQKLLKALSSHAMQSNYTELVNETKSIALEINIPEGYNVAHSVTMNALFKDLGFKSIKDGETYLMIKPQDDALSAFSSQSSLWYKCIALSPLEFPSEFLLFNSELKSPPESEKTFPTLFQLCEERLNRLEGYVKTESHF